MNNKQQLSQAAALLGRKGGRIGGLAKGKRKRRPVEFYSAIGQLSGLVRRRRAQEKKEKDKEHDGQLHSQ